MITNVVPSAVVAQAAAKTADLIEGNDGLWIVAALKRAVGGFPIAGPRSAEEERRYAAYRATLDACLAVTGAWALSEWDLTAGRTPADRVALLRNVARAAAPPRRTLLDDEEEL